MPGSPLWEVHYRKFQNVGQFTDIYSAETHIDSASHYPRFKRLDAADTHARSKVSRLAGRYALSRNSSITHRGHITA